MGKHHAPGNRWWPRRRRADIAAQTEDQARRAAAEAVTDRHTIYDERNERYVAASAGRQSLVRGGTLKSDFTDPAWTGRAGLADERQAVTQ
ncbi:hypothetical protein ACFXG4_27380 [Nocardia sp. NPDC059246]|uniref:hypothetical protein n=1 Tax=unclassified Nocardia TaxID=2637762 RepID=UPI0036A80048